MVVLIKVVSILMMPAKLATLELLKIKIFENKDYDVITSLIDFTKELCYVTQIILYMWSCDQGLATLAFLW